MKTNYPERVLVLISERYNHDKYGISLAECDAWITSKLNPVGDLIDIAESWEYIADNYLYFDYQFGFKFSKVSKHRLILKWK